ncbi:MAG TPA: GFA family protein [Gaiellales bacterium]|jgi:hypothetical protein|nr:GFA family protein [Gaiellales bacterium]
MTRGAACSCGQLRLEAAGDPVRISMCHCLACQRRTGSAFAMQARFTADRVQVAGRYSDYVRVSDEGDRRTFHFCPDCGATVFFTTEDTPDLIAVPVGVFADPSFPPPTVSVYESRRHPWITVPAAIETDAAWESLRPLYEQGRYAEVADRARELIDANPHFTELLYNVACCESLAGRTADALEHLGRAVDGREQFRTLAAGDSDFDPIRDQPGFRELIG